MPLGSNGVDSERLASRREHTPELHCCHEIVADVQWLKSALFGLFTCTAMDPIGVRSLQIRAPPLTLTGGASPFASPLPSPSPLEPMLVTSITPICESADLKQGPS